MANNTNQSRVVIGLIIIAAGAMLLMRNLNIFTPFNYFHFLFSWKMILVAVGLILFFISGNRSSGIILMIIGGFFLIPDIFGIPYSQLWRIGLPLILITVGLLILIRKGIDYPSARVENVHGVDYINEVAIFAGIEKNLITEAFCGGKITVVFGGSEINLSDSGLADGRHLLDLLVVFGGTTIYVPVDWNVKIDVVSVLGGFSDTRKFDRHLVKDSSGELIIKGTVLLGGGEIKTAKA